MSTHIEDSILFDAYHAVGGDKRDEYGSARDGMEKIAQLWQPILGIEISPEHVAACMIAMKLARISGDLDAGRDIKPDSLMDLAGYTEVLSQVIQEEPETVAAERKDVHADVTHLLRPAPQPIEDFMNDMRGSKGDEEPIGYQTTDIRKPA